MFSFAGSSASHHILLSLWLILLHENHVIGQASKNSFWFHLRRTYVVSFHLFFGFFLYQHMWESKYTQFENKVRAATILFPFVSAKGQCETCCLIFHSAEKWTQNFFITFFPHNTSLQNQPILWENLKCFYGRSHMLLLLVGVCIPLGVVSILWPISICWELAVFYWQIFSTTFVLLVLTMNSYVCSY